VMGSRIKNAMSEEGARFKKKLRGKRAENAQERGRVTIGVVRIERPLN
jgi:hypothetical protein